MYKLTNNNSISRLADNASIPADPANKDYREYLAWRAAGNNPMDADLISNPRVSEIKSRLAQIDLESIRSLRAKLSNRGKPEDDAKLTTLDDEAATLRAELVTLPLLIAPAALTP